MNQQALQAHASGHASRDTRIGELRFAIVLLASLMLVCAGCSSPVYEAKLDSAAAATSRDACVGEWSWLSEKARNACVHLAIETARGARHLYMLLDHDGTLAELPNDAKPEIEDPSSSINQWIADTFQRILSNNRDKGCGAYTEVHVVTGKEMSAAREFYRPDFDAFRKTGVHAEFGVWSKWPEKQEFNLNYDVPSRWKDDLEPLLGPSCAAIDAFVDERLDFFARQRAGDSGVFTYSRRRNSDQCFVETTNVSAFIVYRRLRDWFVGVLRENDVDEATIAGELEKLQVDVNEVLGSIEDVIRDKHTFFHVLHEPANGVMDVVYYRAQKQFATAKILADFRDVDTDSTMTGDDVGPADPVRLYALQPSRKRQLENSVLLIVGDGASDEQMTEAARQFVRVHNIADSRVIGVRVIRRGADGQPRWLSKTDAKTRADLQVVDVQGVKCLLTAIAGSVAADCKEFVF